MLPQVPIDIPFCSRQEDDKLCYDIGSHSRCRGIIAIMNIIACRSQASKPTTKSTLQVRMRHRHAIALAITLAHAMP